VGSGDGVGDAGLWEDVGGLDGVALIFGLDFCVGGCLYHLLSFSHLRFFELRGTGRSVYSWEQWGKYPSARLREFGVLGIHW
jgi:hypothetical protein